MSNNELRLDTPLDSSKPNKVPIDKEFDQVFFSFIGSAPTVEIHGNLNEDYLVQFFNSENNELIKEGLCKSRHRLSSDIEYFIPWRFVVTNTKTKEILKDFTLTMSGKTVLITYESSAIGDTIAWMPYIDEFRKKHKCNVICSSFHNDLFESSYPDIKFIQRGEPLSGIHVFLKMGWFGSGHSSNRNPNDCHTIPLQKVATDILGLQYKEIYSPIERDNRAKLLKEKYVVITACSTAQFKYWNLVGGWQGLIDWYNSRGYKVVNVGKQPNSFKNVYNYTGKREMKDLKNIIQNSEYFIGLPSGLAWLAWALKKKTVMITGISESFCEYRKDNYRVENLKSCHGCFNNPEHTFNKSDWLYCPEHKNTSKHFECTKTITLDMVKNVCLQLETDIKKKSTHFSMTDIECDEYLNKLV